MTRTPSAIFRRALDLSPDASAHFFYARWLVRRGRAAEALPHLRPALRLSPGFDAARALRHDPASADAARALASALQSLGLQ